MPPDVWGGLIFAVILSFALALSWSFGYHQARADIKAKNRETMEKLKKKVLGDVPPQTPLMEHEGQQWVDPLAKERLGKRANKS